MLKLNQAPTFKGSVQIPLPDGKTAQIECVFKWMSTKDLQAFFRSVRLAAVAHKPGVRAAQWVVRALGRVPGLKAWAQARTVTYRSDFEYLDQIIESWSGVDLPWSREACEALIQHYPHAVTIILGAWAKGLSESRLGN